MQENPYHEVEHTLEHARALVDYVIALADQEHLAASAGFTLVEEIRYLAAARRTRKAYERILELEGNHERR